MAKDLKETNQQLRNAVMELCQAYEDYGNSFLKAKSQEVQDVYADELFFI
jgi:hypothetical protein